MTTAIAWSLPSSARNISLTVGASMSTVDFSFTVTKVITINTMNSMEIISENHLKPSLSSAPPMAWTAIMVTTVMMAEPTPAMDLAKAERFSLSLPLSVNAGIIDQ